jgi:CDP-glucose 4,6-dehydratase
MGLRQCAMEGVVMNDRLDLFDKFWLNKKVLITGHTGFKGSWLYYWLDQLGADVSGVSLAPDTSPNLFDSLKLDQIGESHILDIRDAKNLANLINSASPEVVFHLAAQPLVKVGYQNPIETFDTNLMGTVNLLDGLRGLPNLKAVVMITTDKVYKNHGNDHVYCEGDELGGHDPYSASKAASELVIKSYADSFFAPHVSISSARAGNVIGGGDWAADRIIPDAIRAWSSKRCLSIRNPEYVRPWQHVLEPLYCYLKIAEKTYDNNALAGSYNIGPDPSHSFSVRQLINIAQMNYGTGEKVIDGESSPFIESSSLILNIEKLHNSFGIKPVLSFNQSVEMTINWYKEFLIGSSAPKLCDDDIILFKRIATNV